MNYRREIDGLRAFAVVPVILFHAGFGTFSGGFVGVDVFFVISGYLITSILIRDLDRKEFSILDFYERRARRILPALFLVIACSWPFAWAWMLPLEMKDFAQSTVAAALSISNILFWMESDYFAAAAELKPLLHTWSLGVEEQYYILFPPMLALLWRWPFLIRIAALVSLAVASFVLCVVFVGSNPKATFYFLPFRSWELLAGGLCAFLHTKNGNHGNGYLAAIGFFSLIVSIAIFDKTTPFPSAYALLPVVGTCLLLLFSAPTNWTGRLLALKPLVGIGLISYSAYLWHQPILAFGHIYNPDPPTDLMLLVLAILSFPLAYLSWRFVEQPFRKRGSGSLLKSRSSVFSVSALAIVVCVIAGVGGHVLDGWASRFSIEQQAFLDENKWSSRCMFTRLKPLNSLPVEACIFATKGTERGKVALVGDSVMSSLSPVLIDYLTKRNYTVEQFTYSHCTLHRTHHYDDQDAAGCPDFISRAVDRIAAQDFDLVITAGNYQNILSGYTDHLIRSDGLPVTLESLSADMAATIAATSAALVVIDPHPHALVNVSKRAVRELRTHGSISPYFMDQAVVEAQLDAPLSALEAAVPPGTIRVDLVSSFCDGDRCQFIHEGRPVLSDTGHFTNYGAETVVLPQLDAALAQVGF